MFLAASSLSLKNRFLLPLTLILLITLIAGCSVKLISDYDQLIDQYATQLQGEIETFLIKMERSAGTPEGGYAGNMGFYDRIQGTLTTLLLRAETIAEDGTVAEQIVLLQKNLENLRRLHEGQGEKGLTKELAGPMRVAFNTQFKAIIKLQNALKRGEKVME
ncbi:MAG: hypothetical protein ACM3YE_04420 [Bacteroidota bacterium]